MPEMQMHLATPLAQEAQEGKFGFDCDNTIGGTPQPNKWDDDWVRFFREQRIGHQVSVLYCIFLVCACVDSNMYV